MRGLSADARRDLPLAAVAAATTWLTMLSWRGFSDLWGRFLGPLIIVAIAVPVAGVILRAAPIPRRLGVLIQVVVIAVLVWLILGGSPLHPISSSHAIADDIADAWTSAESYRPPLPVSVPSIAPLLIPCGALPCSWSTSSPAGCGASRSRGFPCSPCTACRSASSGTASRGWSSSSRPAASC